jgi:hypothetical protein
LIRGLLILKRPIGNYDFKILKVSLTLYTLIRELDKSDPRGLSLNFKDRTVENKIFKYFLAADVKGKPFSYETASVIFTKFFESVSAD